MSVYFSDEDFERIAGKLGGVLSGFKEDLELLGELMARAIVQTTLAGIGAGDSPFTAYSKKYQELLDHVGGKPQQTVNLRGVFYHEGHGPKPRKFKSIKDQAKWERGMLRKGALRRAYIAVSFGGKSFTAKTPMTRPALGLNDPESEMSLDLIKPVCTDKRLTLRYTPRETPYMIRHQNGDGAMPKREWFTGNKGAVWQGFLTGFREVIRARALWFNTHETPGTTPPAFAGSQA